MELSKRLMAVADLVTAGHTIADIGTDHAYIPIYLLETGKIPAALAMDVNLGPLKRAEGNIRMHGLEKKVEVRLSDGFSDLCPGEVDTAVIAGMGGGLMIRILKEEASVVRTLKECILQPQSEIEKVRAFLLEEGFLFIQENMVEEDGKYYPMMKVRTPDKNDIVTAGTKAWDEWELKYGKLLLEEKHPVLKEYLLREIRLKEEILRQIRGRESERTALRCRELQQELELARKGMDYYAL